MTRLDVYDINVLDDENDNNIVEYDHPRQVRWCGVRRRSVARSDAPATIRRLMNKFVNK